MDPVSGIQHYSGPQILAVPQLIYTHVAIAPPGGKDRFFILTQGELQRVCIKGYSAWMESINWRRPKNPASFDCRYWVDDIAAFENNWDLILRRLDEPSPEPALVPV
jgi:hypothetical protein